MRKVMQIFRIRKIGSLLLVLLALVAVFPVFFSVTGSLMGQKELNDLLGAVLTADSGSASGQAVSYVFWRVLPLYPTLRSYVKVLLDSPEFFVMFWNSVKITVGVLAGQILVGVPAAWGFARYRFPGKNLLFMIYVALMMMPFQVMMLSNYLVLDQMKLLDHLWGIILPAAFSTFPVFIMYRFFESIPEALMESARLDGAGELLIFIRIGIPLGSAGIISALVLGFLEYWNLIEQPAVFLRTERLKPLSLYISTITKENAGVAFVAALVALLPPLLVFLCGHRYLEQGIAAMGGGSES
jgi:multiple sugar transport system permease protein